MENAIAGSGQLSGNQNQELELVRLALEGSGTAFDRLVRENSPRVYRLALAMLGNHEDAADVQQEAFVTAYSKLGRFRGESSFGTWIYSITARLCLSRRRRRGHAHETLTDDVLLRSGQAAHSPESMAIAAEAADRVRRALAMLAPNDRLLIVLKYVEQLSHKEIAAVLNCSDESSRSRLTRAKKLFRDLYGELE